MVTKREEELKRELAQATVNFNFIYSAIQEVHNSFDLPIIGGWQSQVEQVKKLKPSKVS